MLITRLLTLLTLLVASTAALSAHAQGILVTVTEVDDEGARYWWGDPSAPSWTDTDQALRGLLASLQLQLVEPATHPAASSVSRRVYDRPNLSTTNGVQLASLFGASRVILGSVTYERQGDVLLLGHASVTARFDLHLFSTQSTLELLALQVEHSAYGESPEAARRAALEGGLERVRTMLERAGGLSEAQVGIATSEPVLVFTGLRKASPLVMIKRQLKTRDEIGDALELWAAEGVIAVELNPGQEDPPERIAQAVDALLMTSFEGFSLQLIRRESNRFEIAVLPQRDLRQ